MLSIILAILAFVINVVSNKLVNVLLMLETITVVNDINDFICKLLIHIPRKNFRMVRYYGLYANKCHENLTHAHELLNKTQLKPLKK